MKPWPHQIEDANKAYEILKKYALVYLACEERTGKSLTSLLIAEKALVIKVLIITKKKAYDDWDALLQDFSHTKVYKLTTYHQLSKLDSYDWDLVILDEAHNYISGYPKKSQIWHIVCQYTKDKPIIYLSATPNAQSLCQLYHQFALSTWSPFYNYTSFHRWHQCYGESYVIYLKGRQVQMYDRVKDEDLIKLKTNHLFVTRTRKELKFEHEPVDKIHWIDLDETTKEVYNSILKTKLYYCEDGAIIEYDTKTKLRFGLHMLEGGTLKRSFPVLNSKGKPKLSSVSYDLDNTEKIDYIKKHWGDKSNVAIMYNYIREGEKLRDHFKQAEILQATSNAEGISLLHIDHLIIYSQDFSTARHTQRRARQANKARDSEIVVHFLLVKKGISEEVYNTVSLNKTNYVDMYFTGSKL